MLWLRLDLKLNPLNFQVELQIYFCQTYYIWHGWVLFNCWHMIPLFLKLQLWFWYQIKSSFILNHISYHEAHFIWRYVTVVCFINWNSYPTTHCTASQWKQLWSSILSCPSGGCVFHWKSTNILQKLICILTAEEQAKQETSIKQAVGSKQYIQDICLLHAYARF